MIDGVEVKKLAVYPDERGRLMEIMRNDDPVYKKFGQVYMTTTLPGVVKAWHLHKKQWDNICCILGTIKLALYDGRENSKTRGEVNEFYLGNNAPKLVVVPPEIYHGWKCVSIEEAIIINNVTEPYNYKTPDEYRLDAHTKEIPYTWERKDG